MVQTNSGKVRGYIHNGIFTYKGIPYAQAKRFQAPEKPAAWEGIRSSMTYEYLEVISSTPPRL